MRRENVAKSLKDTESMPKNQQVADMQQKLSVLGNHFQEGFVTLLP